MKSVVIGGGGFIGSHLSEALIACGNEVRVFDQPDARFLLDLEQAGAKLVTGDFLNIEDIKNAVNGCDTVFHLISTTVPQNSNENPYYDISSNILGTIQLLDAAKDAQVKKVIFASSGGTVYGIPQEIPIKESHPTDPISSYGISKLAIEKYLHLYSKLHGLNYSILRIANAYGIRQPTAGTQGVIGAFLDKALRNSEITVWGDGSIMRDYTNIGDIVDAFIKVSTYEGDFKIFNVGAGQGHSLNEIISIIEKIIQKPLKPKYLPGRSYDVPVNILDITRAKMHLAWQPKTSLLEGISRVVEWMLEQKGRSLE